MDFRKFLEMISEESTSQKDNKAEQAGRKVAKDIEYDEGHKGKDDERAEEAGEKVTKDIEYDDKKDKKSLKDWFEIIDKNIINEAEQITMEPAKQSTQVIKQGTKTLGTVSNPALAATIKSAIGKGEMSLAGHEMKEEAEDNPESAMLEKWAGDAKVKATGQYADKSVEELKSMLAKLHKSGPHGKDSPAAKKMRQINFALRAKGGWKKGEGAAMKEAEQVDEVNKGFFQREKGDRLLPSSFSNKREKNAYNLAYYRLVGTGVPHDEAHAKALKHSEKYRTEEVEQVDEKAKNPYAIGMAAAKKAAGIKKKHATDLPKGVVVKGHEIAKKIMKKEKTTEAERPSDQADFGAGLGAGRSNKVLENKQVNETMNTLEAAYHEGKSHGLSKHGYSCRYDEGSEEHRRYHDGFKEGLDECYGLMPNRGLVVDETGMPPATVPGMASQEMEDSDLLDEVFFFDKPTGPRTPAQQRVRNLPQDTLSQRGGRNTPAMGGQGYKDMVRGTGPFGQTAKDMYGIKGPKGNLPEADLDEMNKTEYMKHKARTTPGDTFKAFGQTMHDKDVLETEMFAFESLDKQLNALLNESAEVVNEGISVNMSQGLGGPSAEDSVSVTAQGEDAAKLLAFIKQVGLGGLGAEKAEEPAAAMVATSDYGAPKFQGHDAMVKLMKLAGGDDYEHEMDHGAVAQAKPCGMHGVAEAECGCGKGKEMVDEVESEDQMEYQVAEDDGEGNIEADEQGAQIDAALAVGSENEKNVTEGGDGMEDSPEAAGAVAAADAEEEQEEAMSESEKLDEWANDAGKDGTEQSFMRDIEFMTKVISGGLNKPKATGQTTIPVIASQDARNGDEDVSAWKKLAGIKK